MFLVDDIVADIVVDNGRRETDGRLEATSLYPTNTGEGIGDLK